MSSSSSRQSCQDQAAVRERAEPRAPAQKATLVDREPDDKELKESGSTTENQNFISVTMETAEQSRLVMDCEVEVVAADSPEQRKDNGADGLVCLEKDLSPSQKEAVSSSSTDMSEIDKRDSSEISVCSETPPQDQKEALIAEQGHEELNRNESVTSSVSDTPSSVDSVYENEAHRQRREASEPDPEYGPDPEQDPEYGPDPEPDPEYGPDQGPDPKYGPDQGPDPEYGPDPEPDPEYGPDQEQDPEYGPDQEPDPEYGTDPELAPKYGPDPEQDPEPRKVLDPEPKEDYEMEHYPNPEEPEPEHNNDFDVEHYSDPEPDPEPEHFSEPDPDLDLCIEPEPDLGDNFLNPEDDAYQNLEMFPDEDPEAHDIMFEPPFKEESILEQCIREEVMSDVSNESCHQDPDELDECLRVEIAANSSDSESDEKWRTIFSSSINKEDDDSYLDGLQLSAQELFVQKVDMTDFDEQDGQNFDEVHFEVPQIAEVLEQPEDMVSIPPHPHEVKYNPLGLQGLSKISEDEGENYRDANHNHTGYQQNVNTDPAKKLPKDFCVIQETKSENVSTEHVDFQLARKQWREMEEQMKNKIILPTTKQPSFHGSHSFMYTPVRNIERAHKKAQDLESLNLLGDYPHTQFSPCSEDSGLDDSSYRSPNDDLETPIDREIRISMEREEIFKRERALSRMGKSTDCAPSRSIPRSISTPLTPSFIITSSPSKEPLKHEVSANVIILEPRNDFTSGAVHGFGKDIPPTRPGEWRSDDTSNLIILETSNLIIRSASDFSLNKAYDQPQEKMFLNNPFFKLRSRSSISLVDEEIKMVKQREEELRKERANLYGKDSFGAEKVSTRMDTLAFDNSADVPVKCMSSPSSPMKTAYRMDRSVLSCDHRFPEAYAAGRRKSAMALRWEAGEFTKND